mmetsp:Transcript_82494/g.218924  ORF Transcript_82494/g.218924 Transcript_82494/m.218924 type:complete len:222 (-) Transcript_82494:527-1192(-)
MIRESAGLVDANILLSSLSSMTASAIGVSGTSMTGVCGERGGRTWMSCPEWVDLSDSAEPGGKKGSDCLGFMPSACETMGLAGLRPIMLSSPASAFELPAIAWKRAGGHVLLGVKTSAETTRRRPAALKAKGPGRGGVTVRRNVADSGESSGMEALVAISASAGVLSQCCSSTGGNLAGSASRACPAASSAAVSAVGHSGAKAGASLEACNNTCIASALLS